MKTIQIFLIIGSIVVFSIVLISCGRLPSNDAKTSTPLPLNDQEISQLEYERLYLDSILNLTIESFGDPEGFNEFGEIYIDNEKEFRFVIAVAKEDERVTSFINEVKGVIPEHLLSVQKVKYSKNDLIAVHEDILKKISEGYRGLSKTNVEISTSVKHQKVMILVNSGEATSVSSAFPEYEGLLEVQAGGVNQPAKEINNEIPNNSKTEKFQINSKDITNVTIYTGTNEKDISGVIGTADDIQVLANMLNNSPVLIGDTTANYYRLLKISQKDDSVITLEFGGEGGFFKNLDTGVFFDLEPEDSETDLNKLIDQFEKEFKS